MNELNLHNTIVELISYKKARTKLFNKILRRKHTQFRKKTQVRGSIISILDFYSKFPFVKRSVLKSKKRTLSNLPQRQTCFINRVVESLT